jgi:predicted class III extradiol MEMO1 family dioxygenase
MASDLSERPQIRPVEVKAAVHKGERVFVLSDPLKLSDKQVLLPLAGLALVELFDGTRTIPELAAEFTKRYGIRMEVEQVLGLATALDQALLLAGGKIEAAIESFRRETVRKPACAGGSYPREALALSGFLDAQYTRAGGPGGPPDFSRRSGGPVRGVISPHIDFHRGGQAYAHAWKAVAESCEAELFVVFGTAHAGTGPARFALTRKDYETPLGAVPTDLELVERLKDCYRGPDDLFSGEIAHRGEHSIEFQMVELAHLYGERSDRARKIRAVPILCGSIHDLLGQTNGASPEPARSPTSDERLRTFHEALAKALEGIAPERVCFVAGVDLAHVGRDFEDPPLSSGDLETVLSRDKATLAIVTERRDPDAFHEDVARDQDARRICGHSAIVAVLEALRRAPRPTAGELLTHDRWYDGSSSVTFASAVFREGARS